MQQASHLTICPVLILLLMMSGGCAREEPSREEPGVEIPLDKIWGYQMFGTKDIRDLEPDHFGPAVQGLSGQQRGNLQRSSLSHQIDMALNQQDDSQPIGPGFAVAGTGREALAAVKEIMEQDQIPPQVFSAGTEVSLFCFTRVIGVGMGFGLKDIKQSNGTVTIRYQYDTGSPGSFHLPASTRRFALIPLGKPAAGSHTVNIVRVPAGSKYWKRNRPSSREPIEERICKSFSFLIESPAVRASINK